MGSTGDDLGLGLPFNASNTNLGVSNPTQKLTGAGAFPTMSESRQNQGTRRHLSIAERAERRRRRRTWVAVVVLAFIALATAVVLVAPGYVARDLVAKKLQARGIDVEGVETLGIDVWNREVWFGPARFRSGDAEPGTRESFGVQIRFMNLLHRRAVVDRLILRGLDVTVTQAADGRVSINGIVAGGDTPRDESPREGAVSPRSLLPAAWHAGLMNVEVRDSRAVLIQSSGRRMTLRIDRLDLKGFRSWQPTTPGSFELDGSVAGIDFQWRGRAWLFDEPVTIDTEGEVRGSDLAVVAERLQILGAGTVGGTLTTQLRHVITFDQEGVLDARSNGTVAFYDLRLAAIDGIDMRSASVTAELATATRLSPDGTRAITGTAGLTVTDATVAVGEDMTFRLGKIDLPPAPVDIHLGTDGGRVKAMPQVTATDLALDGTAAATVATVDAQLDGLTTVWSSSGTTVEAKPRLTVGGVSVTAPVSAEADSLSVALERLLLAVEHGGSRLEAAGSIRTEDVVASVPFGVDDGTVGLTVDVLATDVDEAAFAQEPTGATWSAALDAEAQTIGVELGDDEADRVMLERLTLRQAAVDQSLAATVGELILSRLDARLSDKAIEQFGGGVDQDAGAEQETRPQVRINKILVADGARIRFRDASVEPAVEAEVDVQTLEVANIDTGSPDGRTNLDLEATVNEFTGVRTKGWATLFAERPDFDLDVTVENLELPAFSPYAARAVGANLDSGRLTAASRAAAEEGRLDSSVDLTFDRLAFSPLSAEDAEQLSAAVGMPVSTVVGLLQDGDGRIKLTLPVGGTLEDPQVDLSQAIGKAMGGALAAVFPPTALASLLSKVGEGGVAFNPIPFPPGLAELPDDSRSMADNLARLLDERPRLTLRVCGRGVAADYEALTSSAAEQRQQAAEAARSQDGVFQRLDRLLGADDEPVPEASSPEQEAEVQAQLQALAVERTRAVRRYFADERGLPAGRVVECRSTADTADSGPPRVEVTL